MKVSTKGRYSLRLLLDLAEHADKGFIPLKDIAERQDISKKYLEQIVALLNVSGMLRTNRGYQGGYMLAKAPGDYTVGQILRITEGELRPVACLENEPNQCPRNSYCKTLAVWEGLNRVITEYLDGITLDDLLGDPKAPEDEGDTAKAQASPVSEAEASEAQQDAVAEAEPPETAIAEIKTPEIASIEAEPPEAAIAEPEAPENAAIEPAPRKKSSSWFWNSF